MRPDKRFDLEIHAGSARLTATVPRRSIDPSGWGWAWSVRDHHGTLRQKSRTITRRGALRRSGRLLTTYVDAVWTKAERSTIGGMPA